MPTSRTPIVLPADAASALHAVPKQQLDTGLAGRAATAHAHSYAAYDNIAPKANGTLSGTLSDSGHTWVTYVSPGSTNATPVILNGAIGPAAAFSPGGGLSECGSYAYLQPGGTISLVGAMLRWDTSDVTTSSLAIGAFTQTAITTTSGAANMHLSITPWGCQFSVFSAGTNDFTSLTPEGCDTNFPRFPVGMLCDGSSLYRVEVVIDQKRAKAYVTVGDNPTLVFTHPWIGSIAATYAVWEQYTVPNGTNIPRFTRVWADPVGAGEPSTPQSQALATALAGVGPGRGGSGAVATRPSSRMRHGAVWWEPGVATTLSAATAANATTFLTASAPIPVGSVVQIDTGLNLETRTVSARTGTGPYTHTVPALLIAHASAATVAATVRPTWSDGAFWRDSDGLIAGNRLAQNTATATENSTGLLVISGATIARARAPVATWRTIGAHKVTCSTAGTIILYNTPAALVEVGAPFFAGLQQALAGTTARSATLTLRFYNSASVQVGSDITTSSISIPTGSSPVSFLTAVGVAPAASVTALAVLTITGAAVNDIFYFTDWSVGPGAVAAHLRT